MVRVRERWGEGRSFFDHMCDWRPTFVSTWMWYQAFRMLYAVYAHVRFAHRSMFIKVASTPPLYTMVRMSPPNSNAERL